MRTIKTLLPLLLAVILCACAPAAVSSTPTATARPTLDPSHLQSVMATYGLTLNTSLDPTKSNYTLYQSPAADKLPSGALPDIEVSVFKNGELAIEAFTKTGPDLATRKELAGKIMTDLFSQDLSDQVLTTLETFSSMGLTDGSLQKDGYAIAIVYKQIKTDSYYLLIHFIPQ